MVPGETSGRVRAPYLPEPPDARGWHGQTKAWWRAIWHSPMAEGWLASDIHGLYRLALLVDLYWRAPSAPVLAEIRLEEGRFGLSPADRRRLGWEISPVASKPRVIAEPVGNGEEGVDPRKWLLGLDHK